MNPAAKNILIIIRTPPYAAPKAQEAMDMALAAAVFDHGVSVLLMDDGVYHGVPSEQPPDISSKSLEKLFANLQLFDIHNIWVENISLENRGLYASNLFPPLVNLSAGQLTAILTHQDLILSF
jgi:tRNA 2-thiouridine synthesizing protein C